MRRLIGVLVMSAFAHDADAQPAPPYYGPPPPPGPAAPPALSPPETTGITPRAGIGIGRYTERASGYLLFESDLQPFTYVGFEAAFRAGERGVVVVQAQAGIGIDVHMDATSLGDVVQNNRFHQEIYEAGLGYRWPGATSLYFEIGYHFTAQNLHFTDIEDAQGNPGPIDHADELVLVHGIEGGLGWRKSSDDGSERRVFFLLGLNRGSAYNSAIDGEDFSAGGLVLGTRGTMRFASGFLLGLDLHWRQQNGTSGQEVEVMGMTTTAFWPKNTSWRLAAVAGYAF